MRTLRYDLSYLPIYAKSDHLKAVLLVEVVTLNLEGLMCFSCLLSRSALIGGPVTATDLRAGAALVLAGMAAEGTTLVEGVSHIDRGYELFDNKLRGLGAYVLRLPCLPADFIDHSHVL